MLNRTPSDADRKRARRRRYCRRQATGRVCPRVEVSEHDLAAALLRSGRLTPDQALRRDELERAAGELGADFVERWGGTRPL